MTSPRKQDRQEAGKQAAWIGSLLGVLFLGIVGFVLLLTSSNAAHPADVLSAVGGEGGAAHASSSSSSSSSSAPPSSRSPSTSPPAVAPSLETRVYRLEAEVRELRAALRAAGVANGGETEAEARVEDDARAAALAEAMEGDPAVKAKLREAVQAELQREREERWEARRARWSEMTAERVARFQEATGADDEVADKLTELLVAEQAAVADLFKASGERRWPGMRDQIRQLRDQTDEGVRAALEDMDLLDDEHLAAWQALRDEERRSWRGGQDR